MNRQNLINPKLLWKEKPADGNGIEYTIIESENEYIVRVLDSGIEHDSVLVSVRNGDSVTISANSDDGRPNIKPKNGKPRISQFFQMRFKASAPLNCEHIGSDIELGSLTVRIPKELEMETGVEALAQKQVAESAGSLKSMRN